MKSRECRSNSNLVLNQFAYNDNIGIEFHSCSAGKKFDKDCSRFYDSLRKELDRQRLATTCYCFKLDKHFDWGDMKRGEPLLLELVVDGERVKHKAWVGYETEVLSAFNLDKKTMNACLEQTYFTQQELQLLYHHFCHIAPPGGKQKQRTLSRQDFARAYPELSTPEVLPSIFSQFDVNSDDAVEFKEYARVLSVMCRDSFEARILMGYSLCDLDGDGAVSFHEVEELVAAIERAVESLRGQVEETTRGHDDAVHALFSAGKAFRGGHKKKMDPSSLLTGDADSVEIEIKNKRETTSAGGMLRGALGKVHAPKGGGDVVDSLVGESGHQEFVENVDDDDDESESESESSETDSSYAASSSKRSSGSLASGNVSGLEELSLRHEERTVRSGVARVWKKHTAIARKSGKSSKKEATLSKDEFVELARHDPNFSDCFGLFDYFRIKLIEPLEELLFKDTPAGDEMSGWLLKDKWNYSLGRAVTDRRYFTCHSGFLMYAGNSDADTPPSNVLSLQDARVRMGPVNESYFHLTLSNGLFNRYLYADSPEERLRWVTAIRKNSRSGHRFSSFAPLRRGGDVEWLVNGAGYFARLYDCLMRARSTVLIADWFLSPGLLLKRDDPEVWVPDADATFDDEGREEEIEEETRDPETGERVRVRRRRERARFSNRYRLDMVLEEVAKRGVKVYVLIWAHAEASGFLLESPYVQRLFNHPRNPNITCIRHPAKQFIGYWSHHQKLCVIDEELAFLGGVDLCFNRYETKDFELSDVTGRLFPGRDYNNMTLTTEIGGKTYEDVPQINRLETPRMPWHDVHMQITGLAARDVALNFIQRWNYAVLVQTERHERKHTYLMPRTKVSDWLARDPGDLLHPRLLEGLAPHPRAGEPALGRGCHLQIVRSACDWSVGVRTPERSIYNAYKYAIVNAEHYIYIENQYFITSASRDRPKNRILKWLYERLQRAIRLRQAFKLVVVLPVYPAGDIQLITTRYVIKHIFKSISRQGHSLLEMLHDEFPDVDLGDYVTFHALRNYGWLNNQAVTEQVYVHSKLLIADDRVAICGSANINDRSMRGTRDSEIACVVEQDPARYVRVQMAGVDTEVAPAVRALRLKLWGELWEVPPDRREAELGDVCLPALHRKYWVDQARANSCIYRRHFALIAENISDLETHLKFVEQRKKSVGSLDQHLREWNERVYEDIKQNVRGYVVDFPFDFFSNESDMTISISGFHKEVVVPAAVFL